MDERTIFERALDLNCPEERAAFLNEACGPDAPLRSRIGALLHSHEQAGSFLQGAVHVLPATVDQPFTEQLGAQFGPYKLREQIGEGGFGVVYVAEQEQPVARKVALKIIKPGMDTREVIARFESERQALALMDHPYIAKVLDAGTTGSPGRPYFVMELVKGVPITEFCDEQQLSSRERLELFVDVCRAVQHAHQKGIIHRDIKPSNVMVALHDDRPVVKVIDFGIAKVLSQKLTEKTIYTAYGQMIGTPAYMSPEQAQLNELDVDTRSDVYSLGVLLYELLTGTTPFDRETLKNAGFEEFRRIIREDEPPRPSARISTLNAALLSTISGKRQIDPRKLSQSLRGELDWIVMKALEKDRNRRYETATAFAGDVQRYLQDEPIEARPPTMVYRFHKFARRNKAAMLTAMVVVFAVLLTVAGLTMSNVQIAREQQATENALHAKAQAKNDLEKTLDRERHVANFHRITLAHHGLSADNLGQALNLLEECPQDLREWEWHYLMRLCRVEPLVLQDNAEVNGVAFSPDGERLASVGADGAVKIWNSRTGDLIQTFANAHADSAVCVAFHPHGKHLATAGADRQVKLWDLTTRQEVFSGPCDAVRRFGSAYTVAFRPPDGRQLAAGSEGVVRVWDWQSGRLVRKFLGHESHSIPVAFSPDGTRVATDSGSREGMKIWHAETGEPPLITLSAHRHPVSALVFSADGKQLASASFDRSVKLWNSKTGNLLRTFPHPYTGNVTCVALNRDGRRLASSGDDKTVRLWDATTGREVLALHGHKEMCACVAFSPDGQRLASASSDRTIRIWDATPLRGDEIQELMPFDKHSDEIRSVLEANDFELPRYGSRKIPSPR